MKFKLSGKKNEKSADLKMEMKANSQKKGKIEMDLEGTITGEKLTEAQMKRVVGAMSADKSDSSSGHSLF